MPPMSEVTRILPTIEQGDPHGAEQPDVHVRRILRSRAQLWT